MNPYELAEFCIKNVVVCKGTGLTPTITMNLREGNSSSTKRYPFGSTGPVGVVVMYGIPDGRDTVLFKCLEVLRFLVDLDIISIDEVLQKTGLESLP